MVSREEAWSVQLQDYTQRVAVERRRAEARVNDLLSTASAIKTEEARWLVREFASLGAMCDRMMIQCMEREHEIEEKNRRILKLQEKLHTAQDTLCAAQEVTEPHPLSQPAPATKKIRKRKCSTVF